jgi:hypothetical protein
MSFTSEKIEELLANLRNRHFKKLRCKGKEYVCWIALTNPVAVVFNEKKGANSSFISLKINLSVAKN